MFDSYGSPSIMTYDASKGVNPLGGKTYYVRGGGSDDHEGNDPEFPLATLAVAFAKCVTAKNDYVFVSNYWTATEAPIEIDIGDVHLIGLGTGNFDSGVHSPGGSNPSFDFADGSRDIELAGFSLGNDGSEVCIDVTGQVSRAHIHHCALGWNYGVTDGIAFTPGGALLYPTIDHCYFGHMISAIGISAYLNSGIIAHNLFHRNGTNGFYCTTGGFNITFLENIHYSPDDDGEAAGWAIRLDPNTTDCLVVHNHAGSRGAAASNNPFRDESAAAAADMLNGWVGNFDGEALSGGPDGA